jgi:hypothetical protein
MFVKVISAGALAFAPVPVSQSNVSTWQWADAPIENQVVTATGIDPSIHPEIVRVDCEDSRGSAVKIGPNTLLSVAHVTSGEGCMIGGKPFKIIATKGDFSVLLSEITSDRWLQHDCGGFVGGRTYTAIGFARGLNSQTTIDAVAMGERIWGFERLWGVFTVIPGMSGGGFIDQSTGRLVGMVNVYEARRGDSGSVALKDTSICSDQASLAAL